MSAKASDARHAAEATARGPISRRDLLRNLGLTAMAGGLAPWAGLSAKAFLLQASVNSKISASSPTENPRWYGFNLLEYFSTDPDWMKYFPYKNDGTFQEDDFRWIRDWGFNWVRLPMDYRFWTDLKDLFKIREDKVAPIDRAIRLGDKYGIHVNLCLHRAPGYCILDFLDEAVTGIHIDKEKTSVFTDSKTLDAFVYQWTYFADRCKGISREKLSFNVVNEPLLQPTVAELAELKRAGKTKPVDIASSEVMQRHAQDYVRVARAAIEGIRKRDPERLIITDGLVGGTAVVPGLFDTHVLQSCHTYNPFQVTHYQCEWARGMFTGSETVPSWPLKDDKGDIISDKKKLARAFAPWRDLAIQGVPIHFGEMGCYKHTPPAVVLAWFDDTLNLLQEMKTGWALWNFRGPFGVLDTQRAGTKYEHWHGHQLDRALLNLLQRQAKA